MVYADTLNSSENFAQRIIMQVECLFVNEMWISYFKHMLLVIIMKFLDYRILDKCKDLNDQMKLKQWRMYEIEMLDGLISILAKLHQKMRLFIAMCKSCDKKLKTHFQRGKYYKKAY